MKKDANFPTLIKLIGSAIVVVSEQFDCAISVEICSKIGIWAGICQKDSMSDLSKEIKRYLE